MYQLLKKDQILTQGTLLDCWKELVHRYGWISMGNARDLGIKIEKVKWQ